MLVTTSLSQVPSQLGVPIVRHSCVKRASFCVHHLAQRATATTSPRFHKLAWQRQGRVTYVSAMQREKPGPGQESVWDYPRPPRLEQVPERITVELNGKVIADTTGAYRVLETSHPPTYYLPPKDVDMQQLTPVGGNSYCEWKGTASYYDAAGKSKIAWYYPKPTEPFKAVANYICFYPSKIDKATVGGETVTAQPGDFYGGWITSKLVGPFKGSAGTMGW